MKFDHAPLHEVTPPRGCATGPEIFSQTPTLKDRDYGYYRRR